jgi:hypothetical protein
VEKVTKKTKKEILCVDVNLLVIVDVVQTTNITQWEVIAANNKTHQLACQR